MTFMKNETRFAQDDDYDEVRTLWDKTFEEDSPEWREWYFKYIYKSENCLILMTGNKLVSMSHINPYPMMLNLKEISSAALAGIATEEAMRGKGFAAHLIKESLKEMLKRGVSFSFLYPFNYDFYRKYGYEQCYENYLYTVKGASNDEFEFLKINETVQTADIYAERTKGLNGFIIRNSDYQKIKLLEHLADKNAAYAIKKENKTEGYVLAEEQAEKIILRELLCADPINAAKALAAQHGKSVEFSSPYVYEGMEHESKPHCMGRIVDVLGVFDGIPAKDNQMVIEVTDDIIAQNNGNFLFCAKCGRLYVSKTDRKEDVTVDIKELAPVALGYTKIMSESALEIYSAFFKRKTPWISEVC